MMKHWLDKRYWLALLAFYLAKFIYKSLKVKVISHEQYKIDQQYLYAFWHGKQFLTAFQLIRNHPNKKGAVLVSPSRDGDLLCIWLKKLGYDVIRGSSRKNNVAALANIVRKLKDGLSIGLGVDGPIGPIYKVKPGMTHLAQKLKVKIIPIGIAVDKKWILEKAWDKYEIPKPFGTGVCYLAAPITIGETEDLEKCNLLLEEKLNNAQKMAEKLLHTDDYSHSTIL